MQTEQFAVGDRVHMSNGSFSGPITTDEFEVIAFFPVEDREPMYRLLSLRDRAERRGAAKRVADDNDLTDMFEWF